MPFRKGVATPGAGRKGYELEFRDKKRLERLLISGIKLVEKMEKGEASIKEQMAYGNIEKMVLKIMDKFVATKTHEENPGVETINIYSATEEDKKEWQEYLKWKKAKI